MRYVPYDELDGVPNVDRRRLGARRHRAHALALAGEPDPGRAPATTSRPRSRSATSTGPTTTSPPRWCRTTTSTRTASSAMYALVEPEGAAAAPRAARRRRPGRRLRHVRRTRLGPDRVDDRRPRRPDDGGRRIPGAPRTAPRAPRPPGALPVALGRRGRSPRRDRGRARRPGPITIAGAARARPRDRDRPGRAGGRGPVHRFTRIGSERRPPRRDPQRDRPVRAALPTGHGATSCVYRYETWVQYTSRRPRARVDLTPLAEELTAEEPGDARVDVRRRRRRSNRR